MPRVVVIGGGVAGLWAAKTLTEIAPGQHEITVLEASRRWGGRVHTQASTETESDCVELGAQWLHGTTGHPFVPIAQQLGVLDEEAQPVETVKAQRGESRRRYAGTRFLHIGSDGAHQILSYNARRSRGYQQHQEYLGVAHFVSEKNWRDTPSVGEFARSRLPDDLSAIEQAAAHFSEIVNASIEGDMLSKVSLQHYHVYQELPGYNVIVPGGLSAIVNVQVDSLSSNPHCSLHLNQKVTRIQWDEAEQPIHVHCDGTAYEADVVLCAVSLGVLRDSMKLFQPPLPAQKSDCIRRMGFGVVNKVILFFPSELSRFWDPDPSQERYTSLGVLPEGVDPHQYESGDAIPSHVPLVWNWQVLDDQCLIGWTAGSFAEKLETMTNEQVASHCCQFLQSFAPQRPLQITKALVTRWKGDPHFRGSYSYISCHSGPEDIEALRLPVKTSDSSRRPALFFAGEATSSIYFSTMHGAAMSGIDAAEQIHRSLLQE